MGAMVFGVAIATASAGMLLATIGPATADECQGRRATPPAHATRGAAGALPFGAAGPPPLGAAGQTPLGAAGPPPVGAAGPPPTGPRVIERREPRGLAVVEPDDGLHPEDCCPEPALDAEPDDPDSMPSE